MTNKLISEEKYKAFLENQGKVTELTCLPYKNAKDIYIVQEITDKWRNYELNQDSKFHTFHIIKETSDLLLFLLLDKQITYSAYQSAINGYLNKIKLAGKALNYDFVFQLSAQTLLRFYD